MRLSNLAQVVAILLVLTTGCKQPETVLRVANWGGAGDASDYQKTVDELIQEFETQNPGVRVRVENTPDAYVSKMTLGYIARSQPDVMMLDASSAAHFISNGIVADLSPFFVKDPEFHLEDFFENVVDISRRGKAVYAIPQGFTPMVMYYNKRLFDSNRVPYPKAGWNFVDFRQTAQRLTSGNKHGFVFANWMAGWVMWLWNNGGDVVDLESERATGTFNSGANIQTIGFLRDLVTKYKVSPSLSQVQATGVDPFANGDAAMTISGHWAMLGYKKAAGVSWEDLGIVELPHNTQQHQTVMYESGYAIGTFSKQRELAWKFIKYMTSYKVQIRYNASGIEIDGRKDVARERATTDLERSFLPIIDSARPPYGSKIIGYELVEQAGASAMDTILNGADIGSALTNAASRIDAEFKKRDAKN